MSHFDDIYEIAVDRYGLVTYAEAKAIGVTGAELARWEAAGRLEKCGHGVYKLARYVPTPLDRYAEALALVGRGSAIWGESVLAMRGMAYANPPVVYVAVDRRVRRRLPPWIELVYESINCDEFEGIACQALRDAIISCVDRVLPERLEDAAREGVQQGVLSRDQFDDLKRELRW